MDKLKAIQLLEKYKNVGNLLGLQNDIKLLDEIVEFINENNQGTKLKKEHEVKKPKYGEENFNEMVSVENIDLNIYDINQKIMQNKDDLVEFWSALDLEAKEKFTIFELNIMLYLISNQYKKYQKNKKSLINILDRITRDKRQSKSYSNIVV